MKRLFLVLTILVLGVAVLAITTLAKENVSPAAPNQGDARVRVVHAIPDAPAVDVYVDGGKAFGGVAFKDQTVYATLPPNDYLVQVVVSGTVDLNMAVFSQTLTLSTTDYSVLAMGTLTTTDTYTHQLQVYEDNNAVPALSMAHVRFIHASPGAPAVDVAVTGGPILFSNVAYMGVGDYTPVAAGTYDLEVRPTGTMTAVLTTTVMLDPNNIYTVFAMGLVGDTPPLEAVPSLDQGYARLRVFHGATDAPPVDVWVNGAPAFTGVAYKDLTDYAVVTSDTYTVNLAAGGTPVFTATLPVAEGADYTVAAAGTFTDTDMIDFELLPLVDDNSMPAMGKAHVRFVHLSPDAPAVDIGVTGVMTPLFSNIPYQGVGGYLPVDAGVYDLEVRLAGGPTVVLPLAGVRLKDGVVYTIFAVGRVTGPGSLITPLEAVLTPVSYDLFLPLVMRNFAP